jgi:hypothetical protein
MYFTLGALVLLGVSLMISAAQDSAGGPSNAAEHSMDIRALERSMDLKSLPRNDLDPVVFQ